MFVCFLLHEMYARNGGEFDQRPACALRTSSERDPRRLVVIDPAPQLRRSRTSDWTGLKCPEPLSSTTLEIYLMKKLLPISPKPLPWSRSTGFRVQSHPLVSLSLAAVLVAGCAAHSPKMEQRTGDDSPGAWTSWISSLPVEVHGTVPGGTSAQTIAAIEHGVSGRDDGQAPATGLDLKNKPRVVVYVGGTAAPWRDQYCSPEPSVNLSAPARERGLVLLSELCDGTRSVAHAQITLSETKPTADMVTRGIERTKSYLAQSLVHVEPDPQRYNN